MEAKILLRHSISTPSLILTQRSPFTTHISLRPTLLHSRPLKATGEDRNNLPSPSPPTDIRFRRGSRKKSKEKQLESTGNGTSSKPKPPPKDWESMSYGEKAVELYMGEKGLLFWLNKFAYASIYIIIGAWILFRFVGPSLGFYELDTPPLSPSNILKS